MAINPFPEATLLPVLRPFNWQGGQDALRTKLIRTDEELQHNLWISFAYSETSKLYTVTKDSLKAHGQKGKEIVVEALENLEKLGLEWQISARRHDGTAQVLTCEHEFASESILLPDHLLEAQSILGCQEIVLAVPVAGTVIAQTANPVHRNELDQLMLWAHDNYMGAEGRTLTPNLITAQMGQIRSMYCNPLTDQKLQDEKPSLLPNHYDEETKRITFRTETADIALWEIERLRDLLQHKEMADGRPVLAVRVMAPSEVIAMKVALHLQHLNVEIFIESGNESVPLSN